MSKVVRFPRYTRYLTPALCALMMLVSFIALFTTGGWWWLWFFVFAFLTIVGVLDFTQTRHSVLRNYPILGRFRFFFEFIRPEIRQYFVEGDLEEEPFSRKQRSVVYARAKGDPDVRPFGTKLDVGSRGYEWINHSIRTTKIDSHDFRIWIGGSPDHPAEGVSPCTQPYDASVFNVSAMSFGSLSANAVRSLNWGAKMGNFAQDTGEGGISRYHREHGGDLIWEIGSGYFGCRKADGSFSPERFAEQAQDAQVKMIEIKISQGAKPGHGGILPGKKVTAEIAHARGVPQGEDCVSPSSHSSFSTPLELLEFVVQLRELSGGKPTGFKLCIGHIWEWFGIVKAMLESNITPDFIVVDGAEGGTGAAPEELTDHVGVPVQEGLQLVHNTLVGVGLRDRIKLGAAGKITSAFDLARMFALGADWCNAGRAFMMSVGCIQAQICHTGLCPTGVTTQDPVRQRALVPEDKAPRVAQFHANTLYALTELLQSAGLTHPDEMTTYHIVRRINDRRISFLSAIMRNMEPGAILDDLENQQGVYRLYWPLADAHSFAPHMPEEAEKIANGDKKHAYHKNSHNISSVQILGEMTQQHQRHPQPSSTLVPAQARYQELSSDSSDAMPKGWSDSRGDNDADAEPEDEKDD